MRNSRRLELQRPLTAPVGQPNAVNTARACQRGPSERANVQLNNWKVVHGSNLMAPPSAHHAEHSNPGAPWILALKYAEWPGVGVYQPSLVITSGGPAVERLTNRCATGSRPGFISFDD